MADDFMRLWEEVSQAVPGEDHQPSITDRGKKIVCHSRAEAGEQSHEQSHEQSEDDTPGQEYGDSRGHYIAYLERPGSGAIFGPGEEPVIRDAPDHVVTEIMDRHTEILDMDGYKTASAEASAEASTDEVPERPPLQLRYLRKFGPREAFKAGQLFQELSMAMRGMAVTLPETTDDTEFRALQEKDIRRGLRLVEQTVLSGRQVKIMNSILEAEEELENQEGSSTPPGPTDHEAREFWRITYDQLVSDLEDLIPDPAEREQLLQVQRINRAS